MDIQTYTGFALVRSVNMWRVKRAVDETKCCNTHTKEKEKSGTCCQLNEDKDRAEQQTYEYTIKTKEKNE